MSFFKFRSPTQHPILDVLPLIRGLCSGLTTAVVVCAAGAVVWAADTGRVVGKITGVSAKDAAGAKVVLVQFKLNAKGVPEGAPLQTIESDAKAQFEFRNVPIDTQAVYKLGSRIQGRLVASDPFTFPDGKKEVRLDIAVPGVVSSTEGLHFTQALVAFEASTGAVWVTEVVHMGNPTGNVIDAVNKPLELSVPEDARDLTMMRSELEQENHSQVGTKLLVYGRIQPGQSTIAYRYRLGAPLGSVSLERQWPHPVDDVLVVAPQGTVKIVSDQLSIKPMQKFEGIPYDTWGGSAISAQKTLSLRAQGIPPRQDVLLIPLAGFLVAMVGIVWWFIRHRLAQGAQPSQAG